MWALGLGLLACGSWLAVRILAGYPRPPREAQQLSAREYALVHAAAEVTFPPGGELPPSGSEAGIPAYLDRYLGLLPARTRLLMRCLFFLVEHATLLFPAAGRGSRRRFTSLAPAAQAAYLEGWQRSSLYLRRLVFTSLRAILTLGYFADPTVLRQLGLAPKRIDTPVTAADLLWPRIGEHPDRIPYTASDLTPPSDGSPLDPQGPLHPDFEAEPQ